jgi:hypothetical protein
MFIPSILIHSQSQIKDCLYMFLTDVVRISSFLARRRLGVGASLPFLQFSEEKQTEGRNGYAISVRWKHSLSLSKEIISMEQYAGSVLVPVTGCLTYHDDKFEVDVDMESHDCFLSM